MIQLILFCGIFSRLNADNPPRFNKSTLVLVVPEDVQPGYVIDSLNKYVINHDSGEKLRYRIDNEGAQKFHVDPDNGTITVKEAIDRENKPKYRFECFVADQFEGFERQAKLFVYLTVTDVNDNAPSFQGNLHIEILENATVGSAIFTVIARDSDLGLNSEIEYAFKRSTDIFSLNPETGDIVLDEPLDYESSENYVLQVTATDKGTPPLSSTSILTISIKDISDTAPVFQTSPYNVQIKEDMAVGNSIIQVHAFDGDTGINAAIMYSLLPTADSNSFAIDENSGIIIITKALDREVTYTYFIKVNASETSNPSSSTTVNIIIFLTDVNDNQPTFDSSSYTISIGENIPIRTLIQQGFPVIDADILPKNNEFVYSLLHANNYFIINKTNGYLYTNNIMDFEKDEEYTFQVVATESKTLEKFSGNATVIVQLVNTNDNKPVFEQNEYRFEVAENTSTGSFIGLVKAIDKDKYDFGLVKYEIRQHTFPDLFVINQTSGQIFVQGTLDYESIPSVEFNVIATDHAPFNQNSDSTKVIVSLLDINDNPPVITNLPQTIAILEELSNSSIFTVQATDEDIADNSALWYTITNTTFTSNFLSINKTSGVITIESPFDHELIQNVLVQVTVTDSGQPPLQSTGYITLNILDVNDNRPVFNQSLYVKQLPENAASSTPVLQVFASDLDSGNNGVLQFNILSGNIENTFQISNDGIISVRNTLDREKHKIFNLAVEATDGGSPPLSSNTSVWIKVMDVNDEVPVFTRDQYTATVSEVIAVGTVVQVVSAHDKDIGKNGVVLYSLLPTGNEEKIFGINSTSGEVFVLKMLDWEVTKSYTLAVQAEDSGIQSNSQTAMLNIKVVDHNDNPPTFLKNSFHFEINENFPAKTFVGLVSAIDLDGTLPPNQNGVVYYRILHGNINSSFGIDGLGTLHTQRSLDREDIPTYNITIQAYDGGNVSLSAMATVIISVTDMNDNRPTFHVDSYSLTVNENTTVGSTLLQVHASDRDSGQNSVVKYFLSSIGNTEKVFSMAANGSLTVNKKLDYETQTSYALSAIAQDSGVAGLISTVFIYLNITDANDNPPVFLHQSYLTDLYEAQASHQFVVKVEAFDPDFGAELFYSILEVCPQNYADFSINSSTGVIMTESTLDRDVSQIYVVTIKVEDSGEPPLFSMVNVTINVLDWNTHAPVLHNLPNYINVSEVTAGGVKLFTIDATDKDLGTNAELKYYIAAGGEGRFYVDQHTGDLYTSTIPTDHELKHSYHLSINVTDSASSILWAASNLTVFITDINDNTPIFLPDPALYPSAYIKRISENSPPSTVVIDIDAEDKDKGRNGQIIFSIDDHIDGVFSINKTTGVIKLNSTIDREDESIEKEMNGFGVLFLTVTASDNGPPPAQQTKLTVKIIVADVNDHHPVFLQNKYLSSVTEGTRVGSLLETVQAVDADLGYNARVFYTIVGGNINDVFSISKYTGEITVAGVLNNEFISVYNLTVMASDEAYVVGGKSLNSTVDVQIFLGDINDNAPIFTESVYTSNLMENVVIGTKVIKVQANDLDDGDNGKVWYQIIGDHFENVFGIDNVTGWVLTLGSIDRELRSSYWLTVQAEDFGSPPRKNMAQVGIAIMDMNDNKPVFTATKYDGSILENTQKHSNVNFIKMINVTDADIENLVTYSLFGPDSKYFQINEKNAELQNLKVFDREEKEFYSFFIQATDEGGLFSIANITVHIADENDQSPVLENLNSTITISEKQPFGSVVYQLTAEDSDIGSNGDVIYSLLGDVGVFQIEKHTGKIKLIGLLDREVRKHFEIVVNIKDGGHPPNEINQNITIHVLDAIDSKPYFERTSLTYGIYENATLGSVLFTVSAVDLDERDVLTYELVASTHPQTFQLNINNGEVKLHILLDRETTSSYTVTIRAIDSAGYTSDSNLTILINILDVNDNLPTFENTVCMNDVSEDTANGSIVLTLSAQDGDEGINARVMYSLSSNVQHLFSIDPHRGLVSIRGDLKRHISSSINFTVFASDQGIPQLVTAINCTIKILDINNHRPKFNQSLYSVDVFENVPLGYHVVTLVASERDLGMNALIKYSLSAAEGLFAVNTSTGLVYTTGHLDRESKSVIFATLIAEDNGAPPLQGTATLTIYIKDINDEVPMFTSKHYEFSVNENEAIGISIGLIIARDLDVGYNQMVEYSMNSTTPFVVNQTTGVIFTTAILDRETGDSFLLIARATDLGTPQLSSTTSVRVTVHDINDNYPQFNESNYLTYIPEDLPIGATVIEVSAYDLDAGRNAKLSYVITVGNEMQHFSIGETSGLITIMEPVDIETTMTYNLTVQVFDQGEEILSNVTNVVIILQDVNDHAPRFIKNTFILTVNENTTSGTTIGYVNATDADVTSAFHDVYFDVIRDNDIFDVTMTTGAVVLIGQLDREIQDGYEFTVTSYNMENGNITLKTEALVVVHVLDSNDNKPSFPPSCCIVNVSEGLGIGDITYAVKATDADIGENNRISYSIIGTNNHGFFSIDMDSGIIKLTKSLDREAKDLYNLLIRASDHGIPSLSGDVLVQISVLDVNDERPVFSNISILPVPENASVGTYIATITAVDSDLGPNNNLVSYVIIGGDDSNDLFLNTTTGILSTAKTLDYETKEQYKLQIEAKDHGKPSLSSRRIFVVSIGNINDNHPFFYKAVVSGGVKENSVVGSFVARVHAFDADNDPIFYEIVGGIKAEFFAISNNGVITTKTVLDRELQDKYVLTVQASNQRKSSRIRKSLSSLVIVEILINDENDNPPLFTRKVYSAGVSETAQYGSQIFQLKAEDSDVGVLFFDLLTANDMFAIDVNTGWITSKKIFAGMSGQFYHFDVIVKDNNGTIGTSFNDTALVKIYVLNDLQRIVITMATSPSLLAEHQQDFINILQNVTGYLFNIDAIQFGQNIDGTYDFTKTVVLLHAVDQKTNQILHKDVVVNEIDENYPKLLNFFAEWNVTKYEGKFSAMLSGGGSDSLMLIVLILIGCMVLLLSLIIICLWKWRTRQRGKLKVVATSPIRSDVALHQISSPTRRIHNTHNESIPISINPSGKRASPPICQPYTSKFTSFYGNYTLEPEGTNNVYLEPGYEEEEDKKKLALLKTITLQEEQKGPAYRNAVVDDDEYYSDDMTYLEDVPVDDTNTSRIEDSSYWKPETRYEKGVMVTSL